MSRLARGPRAFTLIELLVVVAIVGLLSGIALTNMRTAQVRAKVAATQSDLRTLRTAIESYQIDHGESPLTQGPFSPSYLARLAPLTSPIAYITLIPRDPFQPLEGQPFWERFVTADNPRAHWEGFYVYNLSSAVHGGMVSDGGTDKRNAWSLTGAGPNRNLDFPYYYYGASFAVGDRHLAFVYDPSNGVDSGGDIFERGGITKPH